MRTSGSLLLVMTGALMLAPAPARAQTAPAAKPTGRVSFMVNSASSRPTDGSAPLTTNQLITSVTFGLTDGEGNGVEYAVDARESNLFGVPGGSERRVSLYDAYAGARMMDGRVRVRAGSMWLSELGGLGSFAGALAEYRRVPSSSTGSRLRAGGFYGVEPSPLDLSFVSGVRKYGGYAVLDAPHGRRHAGGFVRVENHGMGERSVLTFTNFVPWQSRVFLYQAGEYDLTGPAGQGRGGLTYFLANGRIGVTSRLDVQADFHRGRSIDARTIADDLRTGQPVPAGMVEGLLYESAGGRVSFEVVRHVRVNTSYSRDRTNNGSAPTHRVSVGLYASDIASTGLDLTFSATGTRADGRFGSIYASLGRQFGRAVYLSGDFTTSVSVVNFTRADGLVLESRPYSHQAGGNAIVYLGRHVSLLVNVERTRDQAAVEWRALSGVTYRIR